MSKKYLIIIIICIVLLLITFFIFKHLTNKKNPKELELIYKINAGIPFRWEYTIEDESVVAFVQKKVIKDENKGALVGAPVYTKYIFKGLKPGTTKIVFKYVNFTTNESYEKDEYIVLVDEELNIKIVDEGEK